MSKKKQPYIPIYTGDYLKDTRSLSLEAKGAWMDLILFIWVNGAAGMIEGTMEDFARMVGTSEVKFASILLELKRKNICDVFGDETKVFKIVCRRMARESAISEVRSENGSKGGSKTQANNKAKSKQKPDNDIDNDNESEFVIEFKGESEGKNEKAHTITVDVPQGTNGEIFPGALVWDDELYRETLDRLARSHNVPDLKNLLDRWEGWYVNKFEWRKKDLQEMRISFESWIKDPKSRQQQQTNFTRSKASVEDVKQWQSE